VLCFLCVRVCGADLLRLRVCLCVVKIVFLKKSSDFFRVLYWQNFVSWGIADVAIIPLRRSGEPRSGGEGKKA